LNIKKNKTNKQTKSHKTKKGQHNLSLIGTKVKHTQFFNLKYSGVPHKMPFLSSNIFAKE